MAPHRLAGHKQPQSFVGEFDPALIRFEQEGVEC
jgi:hypothetical protein